VHGDHFRGVDHFDVQPLSARVRDALPPQFSADALFLADKENSGAQVARRLDCAFNLYGGGVIPTHCVNGDGGEHGEGFVHVAVSDALKQLKRRVGAEYSYHDK
jgi:hypothetical protein